MRYFRNFVVSSVVIILMFFCSAGNCYATDFIIVDVSQQLYSYESLCEDMALLTLGHEDIMSYESRAITSQGRNVWLIKFGDFQAENKILITASIHAREYMSSQLVMRMLEEYVLNYDVPNSDGITYRQCFVNTCFYILPMVNPDGVTICQNGTKSIKANANGVDLNRNFPLGFGSGPRVASVPGLAYYPGVSPLSEPETQAMAILLNENDFCAGINYHSMGNIIYYGASTNTPEVAEGCKKMADLVHAINGYRREYCGNAIGSFADYFGTVEMVPSVTIEIGTANPVPISQFSGIYAKNLPVWPIVALIAKENK